MADRPQLPGIESLLAQTEALRSLAGGILGDCQAAEDVAQDGWVRALERPPRMLRAPGAMAAWLARVTRNLALNRGRSEARRRAREGRVPRPEALPEPAEMVERAELLREVVQAVLELPEPYRGAVWLRYFESLSTKAVAARLEVPEATVRTHLHRAHHRLRLALEQRHGREALLPLLAGMAGPVGLGSLAGGAAVGGILVMNAKLKILATAAGVLLLASVAVRLGLTNGTDSTGMAVAPALVQADESAQVSPARPAVEPPLVERVALNTTAGAGASIRVRLVDGLGAPIRGGRVRLGHISRNWLVQGFNAEDYDRWLRQVDAMDEAMTGPDGVAILRGVPTEEPFVAYGDAPGFCLGGGMGDNLPRSSSYDLGDLVLRRGGDLKLRILAPDGSPVPDAELELRAEPVSPPGPVYVRSARTDENGLAALPNLLDVPHDLVVTARNFLEWRGEGFQPVADPKAPRDVILDPGLSVAGVVRQNGTGVPAVSVYVVPETWFPRVLPWQKQLDKPWHQAATDAAGHYTCSGLVVDTRYVVAAYRTGTVWAASEPVVAGATVDLDLPLEGTLRGRLVYADGQPAGNALIGIAEAVSGEGGRCCDLRADDGGRFTVALAGGSYGVAAWHIGGEVRLAEPVEVAGDTDLGNVLLSPGVPLTVRARSSADRSPIAAWVTYMPDLEQASSVGEDAWLRSLIRIERTASYRRVTWDAERAAHVDHLPPGIHRLHVTAIGFVSQYIEVDLRSGQSQEREVLLDLGCTATLRIANPDGSPCIDRAFLLRERVAGSLLGGAVDAATTNVDGVARFQELPPGRYRLTEPQDQWARPLAELELAPGENAVQVLLPVRPDLRVRVTDAHGAVEGALVRAMLRDDRILAREEERTGPDGIAAFAQLWAGEYGISVTRDGSAGRQRRVQLQATLEEFEFHLDGFAVSGTVTPPSGAQVSLSGVPVGAEATDIEATTALQAAPHEERVQAIIPAGADGSFRIADLPPGLYSLFGTAAGCRYSESMLVRVRNRDVSGVEIAPPQECPLLIRVTGLDGYRPPFPIESIYARLVDAQGYEIAVLRIEHDGEHRMEKLGPGRFALRFLLDGMDGRQELLEELPVGLDPSGAEQVIDWSPPRGG